MATTKAQEYAEQIKRMIADARGLSDEARAIIVGLLAKADREIIAQIAQLDPASFSAFQLSSLRDSILRTMAGFRTDATRQVNNLQEKAYTVAMRSVEASVAAGIGTTVSLGMVNPATLRIAQSYTADLISGLSSEAATKINGVIQRVFLGGQSMSEIIAQVGRALEGGRFSGIFTEVGDRAVTIAVNEVMRVHSIAGQARMEDLAKNNPSIRKMWVHVPAARVPRVSHLLADGQVVKVDEAFEVAGEQLQFPRDPHGSAENTINCHCISIPYIDSSELFATEEDRAVLAEAGIKIAA